METTGLFISFEGIDGSGKSTQLQLLLDRLRHENVPHIVNREPGGSAVGQQIRQVLLHPGNYVSPTAELLLYFANRAQNVDEVIRPALAAGKLVISDRYTDSTIAYQGAARDLGAGLVRQLHAVACRGTEPDLTIYLRISPETGAARLRMQRKDRLEAEGLAFQQRVFAAYEELASAEPQRIVAVNGERLPALIAEEIHHLVEQRRRNYVR